MRIFHIDDDDLSLILTHHLFKLEGFTDVQPFLSAQEALEFLVICTQDEIPDIILLDVNMPGMDGWEFLDALSPLESKLRGKCRIYILTSSLEESDIAKSQQYSLVLGFFHKPITTQVIRAITTSL